MMMRRKTKREGERRAPSCGYDPITAAHTPGAISIDSTNFLTFYNYNVTDRVFNNLDDVWGMR